MGRLDFHWTLPLDAPVEEVFSFLRDPETMFLTLGTGDPDVEVHDVETTPEGVGSSGRVVFPLPALGRFGVRGSVVSEIREIVPNRRIVLRSKPAMGRLVDFEGTWAWTLEPRDGGTKLTVDFTERANPLVYALDRLTRKQQTREFGERVGPWIESGIRTRKARRS